VLRPPSNYESGGQEFESLGARHKPLNIRSIFYRRSSAMQNEGNPHGFCMALLAGGAFSIARHLPC
jgi:hypothetical protein